jgi:hypothetical protein
VTDPTVIVQTEPVLVDLATAARLLSISEPFLRSEMAAGRIAAQRAGAKKIVFRPEELRRYAESLQSWEPPR